MSMWRNEYAAGSEKSAPTGQTVLHTLRPVRQAITATTKSTSTDTTPPHTRELKSIAAR